jgi:type I restriction enzyme S subunit
LSSRARESALNSISTAQTQEEFNTAWNRIQQNWEVIAGTPESVKDIRRLIVHLGLSGWLTKNLSDFQDKALGEIVTLINGRAYKQQELLQSGIPVIRIQNLNGGNNWFYSNLELPMDKKCVSGDLLFAWSASFGPYIWNGPEAIYHYHIWKVVPSSYVTKDYLYYLLQDKTEEIKSASHGLAMLHMTKSGMESMMVRIPSIEQQNHAVRMIKELLGICDELEACLIAKDEFSEKLSRSIVSASA